MTEYGKPNCKHETTTPIINLPGVRRCDECGVVVRPKMTLDEAIRHCEELAKTLCGECSDDHMQLAKWLKELKSRRKREMGRPELTRYEWLRSLTVEELAEELAGDITDFLLELIGQPNQAELCKAWLREDMYD